MPRPLSTPGKDPVPIVQEAGWAPGPVWKGAENLAPPGLDPWTIQPVASRYTDWATRPTDPVFNGPIYKGILPGILSLLPVASFPNMVNPVCLVITFL
jgi:hypothetical protein